MCLLPSLKTREESPELKATYKSLPPAVRSDSSAISYGPHIDPATQTNSNSILLPFFLIMLTTDRPRIKAVLFDFMGTCLNWHTVIVSTLPNTIAESPRSEFALTWRQTYFAANACRLAAGLPVEIIDTTHANTLDSLLTKQHSDLAPHLTTEIKGSLIAAWHNQPAWPDTLAALTQLRNVAMNCLSTRTGRLAYSLTYAVRLVCTSICCFHLSYLASISLHPRAFRRRLTCSSCGLTSA